MIKGIGVDIVEIPRVKKAVSSWDKKFLKKVFTPGEIKYCNLKKNKFQHVAVRFAAKEAVLKALGNGWQGKLKWNDIEIKNDSKGKPYVNIKKNIRKKIKIKNKSLHVSLSHNKRHAVAFVVIE